MPEREWRTPEERAASSWGIVLGPLRRVTVSEDPPADEDDERVKADDDDA